VFRPDAESGDVADAPRRSRSENNSPARKTPAALVFIAAIAAALLVYGGTVAGVVMKERAKSKDQLQTAQSTPPPPLGGPIAAKGPGGGGATAQPKANQTVGLEIGNVAPDIVGEDLDGKQFKLSDYRGKVVVIDFWGNW
jgi:cytochrome oxidase Cu insertion factor (SCO1/SenC/PrrC family)